VVQEFKDVTELARNDVTTGFFLCKECLKTEVKHLNHGCLYMQESPFMTSLHLSALWAMGSFNKCSSFLLKKYNAHI